MEYSREQSIGGLFDSYSFFDNLCIIPYLWQENKFRIYQPLTIIAHTALRFIHKHHYVIQTGDDLTEVRVGFERSRG